MKIISIYSIIDSYFSYEILKYLERHSIIFTPEFSNNGRNYYVIEDEEKLTFAILKEELPLAVRIEKQIGILYE